MEDGELLRVAEALTDEDVPRPALVGALRASERQRLRILANTSEVNQLWSDLRRLHEWGVLEDGSHPFVSYLQAGLAAVIKKENKAVIRRALIEAAGQPLPVPTDPYLDTARSLMSVLGKGDPRAIFAAVGLQAPRELSGEDAWAAALAQAEREHRLAALLRAAYGAAQPLPSVPGSNDIARLWHPVQERLTGPESTLLPISFLASGLRCARAVVRVAGPGMVGTGFLIDGNRIVTNHHVLPDASAASRAQARFGYELTEDGALAEGRLYLLDPSCYFRTDSDDDLTVVAVSDPPAGVSLNVTPATVSVGSRVQIIQHPAGGPKQISLHHNEVTRADAGRIQYLTDTLPGSSGSPVFDEQWRLIAVHHAGGWLPDAVGGASAWCNEGIAVERLLALLAR